MKRLIAVLLIVMLAAGCAGCAGRAAKKHKQPAPPVNEPKLFTVAPASELPQPDPAACGKVRGTLVLGDYNERMGNLYLYIIDQNKFPVEIVTIASAFYSAAQLVNERFAFEMSKVPEGTHQIIAVWDAAPPFCNASQPYCAASHKDGIGQSAPITVTRGKTTGNVTIAVY